MEDGAADSWPVLIALSTEAWPLCILGGRVYSVFTCIVVCRAYTTKHQALTAESKPQPPSRVAHLIFQAWLHDDSDFTTTRPSANTLLIVHPRHRGASIPPFWTCCAKLIAPWPICISQPFTTSREEYRGTTEHAWPIAFKRAGWPCTSSNIRARGVLRGGNR